MHAGHHWQTGKQPQQRQRQHEARSKRRCRRVAPASVNRLPPSCDAFAGSGAAGTMLWESDTHTATSQVAVPPSKRGCPACISGAGPCETRARRVAHSGASKCGLLAAAGPSPVIQHCPTAPLPSWGPVLGPERATTASKSTCTARPRPTSPGGPAGALSSAGALAGRVYTLQRLVRDCLAPRCRPPRRLTAFPPVAGPPTAHRPSSAPQASPVLQAPCLLLRERPAAP